MNDEINQLVSEIVALGTAFLAGQQAAPRSQGRGGKGRAGSLRRTAGRVTTKQRGPAR